MQYRLTATGARALVLGAFTETHLAVGEYVDPSDPADSAIIGIPVNQKGNPVPGLFPFSDEYAPPVLSRTYNVDVGSLTPPYVILAHAMVVRLSDGLTKTGWATGCTSPYWRFSGRNWARDFDFPRSY